MELENQVVSLELAKELKENGYPQEGLWWWCEVDGKYEVLSKLGFKHKEYKSSITNPIVAPTVAELGKKLPDWYKDKKGYTQLDIAKFGVNNDTTLYWKVAYQVVGVDIIFFNRKTEAEARAKMWLYLKKNNLLEEVKKK